MTAKKATKTANICASFYEGTLILDYDCVGVTMCRFALCHIMPPDGSEECTYREYGSCRCIEAKAAALKSFRNKIGKELKQIESQITDYL